MAFFSFSFINLNRLGTNQLLIATGINLTATETLFWTDLTEF